MKVDRGFSVSMAMVLLYVVAVGMLAIRLTPLIVIISIFLGGISHLLLRDIRVTGLSATVSLVLLVFLMPKIDMYRDMQTDISNRIRKMKMEGFEDKEEEEEKKVEAETEGYEDVKKAKDENPVPAPKKEGLPMPFTLGEIPSQVKNGPHIDASSTLMKAIQSLNPDQINAMSKDTQQLIETQKSLMGMLGTMKPMLNDGKELMNTFQQMFGQ